MFASPRTLNQLDSVITDASIEIPRLNISGQPLKRTISTQKSMEDDEIHWFPPSRFGVYNQQASAKVYFDLNIFQRWFLALDEPSSSVSAKLISIFMVFVILLSCVQYVLATDPSMRTAPSTCAQPQCDNDPSLCPDSQICEPKPPAWMGMIEVVCVALFSLDYASRMLLVGTVPPRLAGLLPHKFDVRNVDNLPDPVYPYYVTIFKYSTNIMNIVDIVAIVPYYIDLATSAGSSVAIVRVLRLARILRIFKAGKYKEGTNLLNKCLWNSLPALSLLFFYTAIGVILFGSIIYFVESGEFTVNDEYPDGAYLRPDLYGTDKEVSPFTSIPVACYWVIVTATTVGYGELYPTTGWGRFIACVTMYCGVLVLALPISVVGSSFSREYDKNKAALEAAEASPRLQRQNSNAKSNKHPKWQKMLFGQAATRKKPARRTSMTRQGSVNNLNKVDNVAMMQLNQNIVALLQLMRQQNATPEMRKHFEEISASMEDLTSEQVQEVSPLSVVRNSSNLRVEKIK